MILMLYQICYYKSDAFLFREILPIQCVINFSHQTNSKTRSQSLIYHSKEENVSGTIPAHLFSQYALLSA